MAELRTYIATQIREVKIEAVSASEARKKAVAGFALPRSPGITEVSLKVEEVR